VDEASLKEALERTGLVPRPDALDEVARFSKENLGAEITICGQAQDDGQSLQVRVKVIDLRNAEPHISVDFATNAEGERRIPPSSGESYAGTPHPQGKAPHLGDYEMLEPKVRVFGLSWRR